MSCHEKLGFNKNPAGKRDFFGSDIGFLVFRPKVF
jgi:hypothetical protein